MAKRRSSNFIYGGEVFVQQKRQINLKEWTGREDLNQFILILQKGINYFTVWGNLKGKSYSLVTRETTDDLEPKIRRRVGCEKDDLIQEPNGRVYFWSIVSLNFISHQTKGKGHGKNQGYFKGNTFCARDRGRVFLGMPEGT